MAPCGHQGAALLSLQTQRGGWAFGCAQIDSGLSNSQEGQPGLHFNLVLESWSRSGSLPASCGSAAWSCFSKFPPGASLPEPHQPFGEPTPVGIPNGMPTPLGP